jgi:predicted dienelactone hydrolase
VVLFQHGAELSPTLYASYGTHLASWEYVVVMPAMPGPLSDGATHVELAALTVGVLDWIEAEAGAGAALDGRADTSKTVLAGHSLGGKISMLVAADDDRPVAVFGIDPVDSQPPSLQPNAYPSVAPERMGDITVPIGLVGETVNATCDGLFCQPCAPADENFEQYYAAATSPALSIEVLGANHVSFLDDPDCGSFCSICDDGTDTPATTRMLTRRYMTAFLELVVRGEAAAKTWIVGAEIDEDVAADRVTYESKNGLSALP